MAVGTLDTIRPDPAFATPLSDALSAAGLLLPGLQEALQGSQTTGWLPSPMGRRE